MTLRQAQRDDAAAIVAALASDPGVFNLVPGEIYVGGWIVDYDRGFLGLFASPLPSADELDQVAIEANDAILRELASARAKLGLDPGEVAGQKSATPATALAFVQLGGVRWWVLDGERAMFFLSIELDERTRLQGMATETTLAQAFDPVAQVVEQGGEIEASFLLAGIAQPGPLGLVDSVDVQVPLFSLGLAGFLVPDSLQDAILPDVELSREELQDANEKVAFFSNPFVLGGIGTAILVAFGVGFALVAIGPRLIAGRS